MPPVLFLFLGLPEFKSALLLRFRSINFMISGSDSSALKVTMHTRNPSRSASSKRPIRKGS